MAELTEREMAAKLSADKFARSGPEAAATTDPIADTPMVVTLDQLRPYDLNPRVTRNPRYDEILASVRERGLDTSPAITRRPGEAHYIIRNGGNTRLAVLRQLWTETKDERFFRILCLFRPWPARGEIVTLTGHLVENELHGGLTFIERALAVEKARELYEQETGRTLSQSELARRLTADGYPVPQPHISRMQDAVRYLLPAIPTVLYAGLGRPQVERLTSLRRAGARIWEARGADKRLEVDFSSVFQDVLTPFDGELEAFSSKRVQDELIGQMAELLQVDYDTLALEIGDTEKRQLILGSTPSAHPPSIESTPASDTRPSDGTAERNFEPPTAHRSPSLPEPRPKPLEPTSSPPTPAQETRATRAREPSDERRRERLEAHVVSPAPTTERLQSIQRLVADNSGDPVSDFEANVLRAIPVQAGGVYPITDVWYIEPGLDTPERLRVHIAQFAREIAEESGQAGKIATINDGIGFECSADASRSDARLVPPFAWATLGLLQALSGGDIRTTSRTPRGDLHFAAVLGSLLLGRPDGRDGLSSRLSDSGLVKLFRLLRLARRLVDLQTAAAAPRSSA
jgi:ParB family protein of integrating conjugative element (PFGI_1 class)